MLKRKNNKYTLLLVLLLAVTIGYAVISTQLQINGTFNVAKAEWDVHWENPHVITGSVSSVAPTITQDPNDDPNTKAIWSVTFNYPGEYYEFTLDAVNDGNIDVMINSISSKVNGTDINADPSPLPEYIRYSVTYDDYKSELRNNEILEKNSSRKYNIRVEYDEEKATRDTINNMTATTTYTFEFGVTYSVADDKALTLEQMPCPGPRCVYALYNDIKRTGSILSNYVKDPKLLIFEGNRDYHHANNVFIGHIIDYEGKIKEGFACLVEYGSDVPICVEAWEMTTIERYNPSTREILKNAGCDEVSDELYCNFGGTPIIDPSAHDSDLEEHRTNQVIGQYMDNPYTCYATYGASLHCKEYTY